MIHLYRPLFFALILLTITGTSEAQSGKLTELKEVYIGVEDLGTDEAKLGLDVNSSSFYRVSYRNLQ